MVQEKKQETPSLPTPPPPTVLTLADRVREAMRLGLRSIVTAEVSKIDASYKLAESILMTVYDGFRPAEMPADLRVIFRDLHISRDKKVEELTYKVTEDFRAAMGLVEWAIEQGACDPAGKQPPPTPQQEPAAAAEPAKPVKVRSKPVAKPHRPRPAAPVRRPTGLGDDKQLLVLRHILEHGPVRTVALRSAIGMTGQDYHERLKTFLRWARKTGLIETTGVRFGMTNSPTPALKEYLSKHAAPAR